MGITSIGFSHMKEQLVTSYCDRNLLKKMDTTQVKNGMKCKSQTVNKKFYSSADAFLPGNNITGRFEMMTYQKSMLKVDIIHGFIPDRLVDKINRGESWYGVKENVYVLDGVHFSKESIPPLKRDLLEEVKAENNVISFGEHDYFKYVAKDGKEYGMCTGISGGTGFGAVETEILRGSVYDEQAWRYISFWNGMMSVTGLNVPGDEYSREEAAAYLDEAGIKPGFFTINMKDGESKTFYYTNAKYSRMIESKKDYDHDFEVLTQKGHLLTNYEPGSIFKISEKEYVLSENHTLDIPYGEDIYAMEYPKISL